MEVITGYWNGIAEAKGEVLAAWVQAVGSIVAIFVAILVSRHQSNVARAIAGEELDRRQGDRRGHSRLR
jgi:hypothetical protein